MQGRLGCPQVRFGLALRVVALVVLALGNGPLLEQAVGADELALRIEDAGFGGGDLGRGTLDLRRERRRVDGDQQIAFPNQSAFAEVHRLHRAGDARTNVDPLDGFEAARELVPGRNVAGDDGGDGDRRGDRRGRRRRAAGPHAEDRGADGRDCREQGARQPLTAPVA